MYPRGRPGADTLARGSSAMLRKRPVDAPRADDESSSLLWPGRHGRAGATEQQTKTVKALFYAVQVFYSFFIM